MTAIAMDGESVTVDFASTIGGDFDLDRLVRELVELREVRNALNLWEGELTEVIAEMVGRNTVEVDEVGPVQVRRSTDRKAWDKHSLLRVILDSHRPPNADGELHGSDDGQGYVGDELVSCSPDLSRVLDCFNLPSPRVTALKERGIDPGEFCESTPGKLTVVVGG